MKDKRSKKTFSFPFVRSINKLEVNVIYLAELIIPLSKLVRKCSNITGGGGGVIQY